MDKERERERERDMNSYRDRKTEKRGGERKLEKESLKSIIRIGRHQLRQPGIRIVERRLN